MCVHAALFYKNKGFHLSTKDCQAVKRTEKKSFIEVRGHKGFLIYPLLSLHFHCQ